MLPWKESILCRPTSERPYPKPWAAFSMPHSPKHVAGKISLKDVPQGQLWVFVENWSVLYSGAFLYHSRQILSAKPPCCIYAIVLWVCVLYTHTCPGAVILPLQASGYPCVEICPPGMMWLLPSLYPSNNNLRFSQGGGWLLGKWSALLQWGSCL